MKTLVLFNNKGGVGKTTLVYHLAHMFARVGYRTLAVDLDPQANLTSAFFEEDMLEALWEDGRWTVLSCIQPILDGTGDISEPRVLDAADNLKVLAGALGLSLFEDKLSQSWSSGFTNDQAALRATTAFYRLIQRAGEALGADIAIVDVGPNLGAINRAAVLAADFLAIPVAADLFSLQGLRNLGPTIRKWRQDWTTVQTLARPGFPLPPGAVEPVGYVVVQPAIRLDRPAKHHAKWIARIPIEYRVSVLGDMFAHLAPVPSPDPAQLATLRNYRSLMPMAQDARKPMFDLRPADGAAGSHAALVKTCSDDFMALALRLSAVCGLRPLDVQ
jgi:chromosome partitioning protein